MQSECHEITRAKGERLATAARGMMDAHGQVAGAFDRCYYLSNLVLCSIPIQDPLNKTIVMPREGLSTGPPTPTERSSPAPAMPISIV